jgi:excisionase family DNA binding protein
VSLLDVHARLLLTPREAAGALAISKRTLWSWTANGQIPCVRLGRSVRYAPGDLAVWIRERRTLNGLRASSSGSKASSGEASAHDE